MRASNRIPVLLDVDIVRNDGERYKGTVLNLSQDGMLIKTDYRDFPHDGRFRITISGEEDLSISGIPIRREKIRDYFQGVGVEIINPSKKYIDFLDSLQVSL